MKFRKYFVAKDDLKARVSYTLDSRIDGRKCITIYAKDYNTSLGKIFKEYKNESDSMTDYFEMGHVDLFEDHPLYQEARKAIKVFKGIK